MYRFNLASFLIVGLLLAAVARAADLRLGMVGLDTGHVIAFTKVLNNPNDKDYVPGARVVAAVKGGSPDIASSWSRVDGYTKQLQEEFGVKLYPSITEMAKHVDVILIESVDGRPHLVQAREAILAGKPTYIEKPAAASLKDAMEIYAFAKQRKVPVFSSSALRFAAETQAVRNGSIGRVRSAETGSPASLEPTHMDLFWYGVHGVESLFTVMGHRTRERHPPQQRGRLDRHRRQVGRRPHRDLSPAEGLQRQSGGRKRRGTRRQIRRLRAAGEGDREIRPDRRAARVRRGDARDHRFHGGRLREQAARWRHGDGRRSPAGGRRRTRRQMTDTFRRLHTLP